MGKPDKKLKKIFIILGITGAVYGTFRFLLPLVIPFLLAWGLAAALEKPARWLSRRLWVRFRGKARHLPVGMAGVAVLTAVLVLLSGGIYLGGWKLCQELGMFLEQAPQWIRVLDQWLTGLCHQMEERFCLRPECLVYLMREMLRGLMETVQRAAMPYLMANSVSVFRMGFRLMVVSVIMVVAVGLILQEMGVWKRRCEKSLFHQEWRLIGNCLKTVASAWLKTQGAIMLLTTVICMAGFRMMGNPYYLLAGIGVGFLDALPIFGTGTVLIPWAILRFVQGGWGQGALLLGMFVICYFLREILEARLMGGQVGLSPLENLIAMYVGLQLFGIWGFVLGPVGLLLILELTKAQIPLEEPF